MDLKLRQLPFYTDDFLIDKMKVKKWPEFLYHYTSIDTLGCILRNETIRFNRMDKVNDCEEATSKNLRCSNTTQFVSCWTAEQRESIPLWSMYTRMKGVRIGLPTNMFKGRYKPVIYDQGGAMIVLDESYLIKRGPLFSISTSMIIGPNPIFYSDEDNLHYPDILFDGGDPYNEGIPHVIISPIDLGCVKGKQWEFEKEWRYKLSIFGIGETFPFDKIGQAKLDLLGHPVTTNHIDVRIDTSAFQEMELTLAPRVTKTEDTTVRLLLKEFALAGVLKTSKLRIRE